MLHSIKRNLAAPAFDDEEMTRAARLLNPILLTTLLLSVLFIIIAPVISLNPIFSWIATITAILPQVGALFLMRRGQLRLASILLSSLLWLVVTASAVLAGGVRSAGFPTYTLVILIAGLLLGWRVGVVFIALSVAAGCGMLWAEQGGVLPVPLIANTSISVFTVQIASFSAAAALLYLAVRSIQDSLERAQRNECALAESNKELEAEIRERQRIMGALRRSEERYRSILDSIEDGYYEVDLAGSFTFFNDSLCKILGYTRAEIMGMNNREYMDRENAKAVLRTFNRVYQTGEPSRGFDWELIRQDGVRRQVEASISLMRDEEGEPVGFRGIARDITERKQAEEALRRRTEELEARNEELDAFAHTVAHDLRNPLGYVVGFAETLEDEHLTMRPEELKECLDVIARNSRKMANIIDELLLLTGVRKMEVELMQFDMGSVISEALERLHDLIQGYQASIVVPSDWPIAVGYAAWVEEVWVNYLSNAIKYGGRPPRIELGAEVQADGMVCFWVRDNGLGLAPEEQEELFVPFTQFAQVRAKGHGLGLSIVRRIVEKLGGQVFVESEGVPGRGSLFGFTLPHASGAE